MLCPIKKRFETSLTTASGKQEIRIHCMLLFGSPMSLPKLWWGKNKSLWRAPSDKALCWGRGAWLVASLFEGQGDMQLQPRGCEMKHAFVINMGQNYT